MRPYSVVPVRPAMPVRTAMREQAASPFGLSPVRAVTPRSAHHPSGRPVAGYWYLIIPAEEMIKTN
jgi:hypothetical protein